MHHVYICDYTRTPIGRFGGSLASIRADDLAAIPLKALMEKNPNIDWQDLSDITMGCANQAGEDNRCVARMASLLAGLPSNVPATTINRLCGSGMDAVLASWRQLALGEADIAIAGGVESMTRAPFVMPKAESAFSRLNSVEDTTIGWRFINPLMKQKYGVDSMPETAENVAEQFNISREDQDAYALRSQQRYVTAMETGWFEGEITPVSIPVRKSNPIIFNQDEHPRSTSSNKLAKLPTPFRETGSVTAGNASGVNDGAAAVILATEEGIRKYGLTPLARIKGGATAGVAPRIMGFGPAPATLKLCQRLGISPKNFDQIELNEAFASQVLAVLRHLEIPDDAAHVNPNGGGIALGHPLGMSGVRITGTLARTLAAGKGKLGLATMCIGVGQGISIALEAV